METTSSVSLAKKKWLGKHIKGHTDKGKVFNGIVTNIIGSPSTNGLSLPSSVSLGCCGFVLDSRIELSIQQIEEIEIVED